MIKKNEFYNARIENFGSEGQGVCRINDVVVFVEGALPEELIEVKIIKVLKNYGIGKLINIIEKSKDRIISDCPVYYKCGGCNLQHLKYTEQLKFKQNKVANDIKRIGKIETEVKETIGMENPFYYRNKIQFPVRQNKNGDTQIGFFRPRSHDIVEIKDCLIQYKINKRILEIIEEFMTKYNIKAYNEEKNTGEIRHIVTRIGYATKEIMVCLVINNNKLRNSDNLIEMLQEIEDIKSICININKEKTNVVMGKKTQLLWGRDFIMDILNDTKFKISPNSFYQTNPVQTEKLYNKVLEFLDLKGTETIIDAYCGIGTISLLIGKKAKEVIGIEIVSDAIENAKENSQLNNISNVKFITGKAEEEIPKIFKENKKIHGIVVDPPRKGCDKILLESILEAKPEKIVYVSCDSGTLARDLNILCENNVYKISEVQPVDSFSQTYHIEIVVLLEKI